MREIPFHFTYYAFNRNLENLPLMYLIKILITLILQKKGKKVLYTSRSQIKFYDSHFIRQCQISRYIIRYIIIKYNNNITKRTVHVVRAIVL